MVGSAASSPTGLARKNPPGIQADSPIARGTVSNEICSRPCHIVRVIAPGSSKTRRTPIHHISTVKKNQKQSTAGIRWWSPTQLLATRFVAYVSVIERERQFSTIYGRLRRTLAVRWYMYLPLNNELLVLGR